MGAQLVRERARPRVMLLLWPLIWLLLTAAVMQPVQRRQQGQPVPLRW